MPAATAIDPKRPPVDDPLYRVIASVGSVEADELRYQLDRRGLELEDTELERLVEEGHVTDLNGTYAVVVPERIDRGNMRGPAFEDDEILERIKLWAAIAGRPPSQIQWGAKGKLEKLIDKLRHRLQQHLDCLDLYQQGDFPTAQTLASRFGSMNAALVAAGFDARPVGKQPAEELDAEMAAARSNGRERESLDDAYQRVADARESGGEDQLHEALVATAMAAFNEAEQIKPWDPEAA